MNDTETARTGEDAGAICRREAETFAGVLRNLTVERYKLENVPEWLLAMLKAWYVQAGCNLADYSHNDLLQQQPPWQAPSMPLAMDYAPNLSLLSPAYRQGFTLRLYHASAHATPHLAEAMREACRLVAAALVDNANRHLSVGCKHPRVFLAESQEPPCAWVIMP